MIELLVVVSIIAMLVAVLLPSLQKARQQSRRVMCQTNLKQIAMGWQMYLQEYNDRFPPPDGSLPDLNFGGHQGTVESFQIPKILNPYVVAGLSTTAMTGGDVFGCPSDRGTRVIQPTLFKRNGSSYRTNRLLVGFLGDFIIKRDPCSHVLRRANDVERGFNFSATRSGSKLLLVGEYGYFDEWLYDFSPGVYWHHKPCHFNMAFLDGHTDFVHIRKGLHVAPQYTFLPWRELERKAIDCQREKGCR